MQTWEYKTVLIPTQPVSKAPEIQDLVLNPLGQRGWELVTVVPVEPEEDSPWADFLAYFKRPV